MKIGLLGVSFDTGNLGVSALTESVIKVILIRWPDADITFLRSEPDAQQQNLLIMGKEIGLRMLPIRFSKNIFLPYHFLRYVFYGLLAKVLPRSRAKDALLDRNPYFRTLYQTDFVADITGGDSFSDIYGFRRFFFNFLCKWLVLMCNKDLIMLPQTYGPFKSRLSRSMAKYILKRAAAVYSRDRESLEYAKDLLNNPSESRKVRFAPDMAFVLDPRRPNNQDIDSLERIRTSNGILVGLNVSGLLFNGGYKSNNNMFGLKNDYCELICAVVEALLKDERVSILLIPHVFAPDYFKVESDPDACLKIYEQFRQRYPGRIFLVKSQYNHGEIKYIIGLCDFFIGSRMHACISALSQEIPTVGIAYSKKFHGVFESIGLKNCVADMRENDKKQILERVALVFDRREKIREHLKEVMPQVKENLLGISLF